MIEADAILGKTYSADALDELGCLTIVDLAGSEVGTRWSRPVSVFTVDTRPLFTYW